MICVIDVVGGPAKGRRVWIKDSEQIQVGRHSSADLSIPSDPHLSRRHLLIEGNDGTFRARDLGSANGTFVNRAGISAVELFDGDQLQVGMTVLSIAFLPDGTNPHAKDGVTFSSISRLPNFSIDSDDADAPTRRMHLSDRVQAEVHESEMSPKKTGSGTHTP